MAASAVEIVETTVEELQPWRDMYLHEMSCQVVQDSFHRRSGWTREFRLRRGDADLGYGSLVIGRPWTGTPTLFEFFLAPPHRSQLFSAFEALVAATRPVAMRVQMNAALASVMLHAFGADPRCESILLHDREQTGLVAAGARFRPATADEAPDTPAAQLPWRAVLDVDGEVAATGGVLFHYNRPYGDIYMDVKEPFRRRGLGAFIVQELKRLCYQRGSIPAARCTPDTGPARATLQRAGFWPCGTVVTATLDG